MNIFSELKRRNVFKVAIAYALVGWVLMQVAAVAFPPLGLPDWTQTLVVVLVLMGLPIALLLAWAFEITPDGVKRTKNVAKDKSIAHSTGRKLDFTIIALLVVAVGYFAMSDSVVENPIGETQAEQTSIAVLPFVNMSSDAEQEFFSDGISEEILNVLVRIPDLKVAGRTSSFQFKGQNQDLRHIGEALNVNHILEGSVRRSGTKLRITAQLIRSSDGFHLWSETYDRELEDVFEIQDEISKAIADALAVNLGLGVGESLVVERTDDIVAYEKYMLGHQLYLKRGAENLKMAILLFNEAVARDPNFGPAWDGLASVYSVLPSYILSFSEEEKQQWFNVGMEAAKRAISLNPNSAGAYVKLGVYHAYKNNWVVAYEAFDKAEALSNNDADVLDTLAQLRFEAGYYDEAEAFARRAVAIDPNVGIFQVSLARALSGQNKNAEANARYEKVLEISSNLSLSIIKQAFDYMYVKDWEAAKNLVERAIEKGLVASGFLDRINTWETAYNNSSFDELNLEDMNGLGKVNLFTVFGKWQEAAQELERVTNASSSYSAYIMFYMNTPVIEQPLWRELVRKYGFLELWQTRGFPKNCQAVGEDDFKCSVYQAND